MANDIIKRKTTGTRGCLTLWLPDEYREKYKILTEQRDIRMAEMIRRVVCPEIDRIWDIESQNAAEDQAS